MELRDASIAELQKELERRKTIMNEIPTPLPNPNFGYVKTMVIQHVNGVAETKAADEDFDHYLFEETMKAVYGPDIFEWYNQVLR